MNMVNNHILPSFLGIGVERGGTTWLWNLLKSHPEIYLCSFLKEIKYFDKNYERGLNWYKNFFPDSSENGKFKAIGEITPNYIFKEEVPSRILNDLDDVQFIILLRNPVNRAISSYKYAILNEGIKESFGEYLDKNENVFKRGLYYNQIKHWMKFFEADSFLILIYEEILINPLIAVKKIADFLKVDYRKFKLNDLTKTVNISSNIPRLHFIYLLYQRFLIFLKKKNLYVIYKIVIHLFLKYKTQLKFLSLGLKQNAVNIDPQIKKSLLLRYRKNIEDLSNLIDKNLSIWYT